MCVCVCLHVKCQILSHMLTKLGIFSTYFQKVLKYQIWWKSVSSGSRVVQRVRTGVANRTVAFRNVAQSGPKKLNESEVLCAKNKVTKKLRVKFFEIWEHNVRHAGRWRVFPPLLLAHLWAPIDPWRTAGWSSRRAVARTAALVTAAYWEFCYISQENASRSAAELLCNCCRTSSGDKSTVYISVTLYWGYLIVLWLFHLVCILCCGCFNWFCNVCVCVYVWVL